MLVSLFAAVLLGAAAPPPTDGLEWQQHMGAALPQDAALQDSDGPTLRLGSLLHARPLILDLGYFTCPTLCGVVRDSLFAALAESGLRAGRDYSLLDLSIDAAEHPADAARAKADDRARFPAEDADSDWHFATATQPAIDAVAGAVGFPRRWDARLKQFLHPTGIVVATADGRISGYLLGVGYTPGDLRAAVVRARTGGIARAALPVLLLCFHFDPTTGRYSFAILKALRLLGVLTVLTLIGLFALLRRGARQPA